MEKIEKGLPYELKAKKQSMKKFERIAEAWGIPTKPQRKKSKRKLKMR